MNGLSKRTTSIEILSRMVCRWATVGGFIAVLATSVAQAATPPDNDCKAKGNCLPGSPSTRDGFALRLASYEVTQSPLAGGMGVGGPALPIPDGRLTSAALAGICGNRSRDQPTDLFAVNRLALAGRYDAAQAGYTQLASSGERGADIQLELAALSNLAAVTAAQGRSAEAKGKLELVLQRYQAQEASPVMPSAGSATAGASPTSALAAQLARMGMNPAAIDLNAAMAPLMALQRTTQIRIASAGVLRTLLNLGNLAGQLGQYAEAEALFERALTQSRKLTGLNLDSFVYAEFSVLYRKIGKADVADDYARRVGGSPNQAGQMMMGFDLIALGRSAATIASNQFTEEAELNRPSHYAEAAQLRMQAEARAFERSGDLAGAAIVYSRSATLAASVSNPEREQAALADLARVHAASVAPALAIFSGKRAVNAAQRLRTEVLALDRQARQAYLADKKASYSTLASLLLQQGRLAEAEQVLRLLKEDEGQQFRRTQLARGSMPYSLVEAQYEVRYEALASRTRALEGQREAIRCGAMSAGSGAYDDREQLERARVTGVLGSESMVAQMETGPQHANLVEQTSRARAIAAKPAAARSTAERELLLQYQQGLPVFVDFLRGLGASLRSVKRDGPYFVHPVSAADLARIDALIERIARLQSSIESQSTFLAGEPVAPAMQGSKELAQLFGFGMGGAMNDSWAIDRQLEALDAERGQLDAELLGAMGGKQREAELAFTAADNALLDTGRGLLGKLPSGTVAIYYLSGERQLDILVVSREGRSTFRQSVSRSELEQRIRAFRQALQNPRFDPTVPAKALYDVLIAPVDAALRDAGATTLMLALDGQLRYLPFAALHDGHGWLAERYAADLYTTAAPAALTAAPAPKWRAAAFGSTAGGEGFSPLPAVRAELEGVVRDASLKTQGALPGIIRLDRNFTAASLRGALREQQNVVHIASHFAFRAGDANASFLLLGDGSRLTVADMATPEYRFDQVDLVTLSACETALSGDDSYGQEVEGLGTLLQAQGAAAVLATLWSVADDSTATFMRALYTQREQRKLSRAEAVREAQLILMRGGLDPVGSVAALRGASRPGEAATATAFPQDANRPWAHPYYWAPFVLMGNWL